jgi:hypothetical protein
MNNTNKNENMQQEEDSQNLIPESILEIIKREEQEEIHALQKTSLKTKANKATEEQEGHKTYAQLEKEVEEGKKVKIGECV